MATRMLAKKLNKAEVDFQTPAGPGARKAAKQSEAQVSDQNRATLDPERHQRP